MMKSFKRALKIYKRSLNSNNSRATYKEFFSVWERTFVSFGDLVLSLSILKGHNFLNSILFLTIFSASNASIEVQVLFKIQKQ
jgi:hypothetical protein